jgi:hypothetical protein
MVAMDARARAGGGGRTARARGGVVARGGVRAGRARGGAGGARFAGVREIGCAGVRGLGSGGLVPQFGEYGEGRGGRTPELGEYGLAMQHITMLGGFTRMLLAYCFPTRTAASIHRATRRRNTCQETAEPSRSPTCSGRA